MARSRSSAPPGEEPVSGGGATEAKHRAAMVAAAVEKAAAVGKDEAGMSEDHSNPAAADAGPAAETEETGTHLDAVTPETAGASAADSVSRVIYTGCYALAYGVVYAAVFVAQSLPQENPFMHGLRDGGKAAVDELSIPADANPVVVE